MWQKLGIFEDPRLSKVGKVPGESTYIGIMFRPVPPFKVVCPNPLSGEESAKVVSAYSDSHSDNLGT